MAVIYNSDLVIPTFGKENRKEIAKFLYSAAYRFFKYIKNPVDDIIFKEVHLTPQLRCDILRIDYNDKITILELKSCKEDFMADNKWEKYLDYCDYFYFMCPENVISEKEIGDKAGLIYINKNGFMETRKKPVKLRPKFISSAWLSHVYKKLAFRKFLKVNGNQISLDEEILFN